MRSGSLSVSSSSKCSFTVCILVDFTALLNLTVWILLSKPRIVLNNQKGEQKKLQQEKERFETVTQNYLLFYYWSIDLRRTTWGVGGTRLWPICSNMTIAMQTSIIDILTNKQYVTIEFPVLLTTPCINGLTHC